MINGNEDAANIFARGHYSAGKEIIAKVEDRIRREFDKCDNCQGFILNYSVGGGTGSGLGTLILQNLSTNYRRKSKMTFEIYPTPTYSTCVIEPYNTLLAMHRILDFTEVSLIFDNEALYNICQKKLDISHPTFSNVNKVISKAISSHTSSLRFEGELNVDLNEFQTNLVPFPRLHFMTSSFTPIYSKKSNTRRDNSVSSITNDALDPKSFFTKWQN